MIFEHFTQADNSTSRKYGGTGLGLSICQHLVCMMGGKLWVESSLAQGSTFHFTVKFGISQRDNARPGKEDRGTHDDRFPQKPLTGIHILLGEAHPVGLSILKKMVIGFGGTFAECSDGPRLLAALQEAKDKNRPFDVVLIDEVLLREEWPDPEAQYADAGCRTPPVVLLPTNMSIASVRKSGWLQNALSLKKPVRRFQWLNRINQLLGKTAPEQQASPELAIKPRTDVLPLQILLVEDLVTNQRLATTILSQAGHLVTLANHGEEALHILKEKKVVFDLILMDLQMPVMDGFEATMHIREGTTSEILNPNIPIIAVTASAMISDQEQCHQVGMTGYLRKPYRPHELLKAVEPFLKIRAKPIKKMQLDPVETDPETWIRCKEAFQGAAPKGIQGLHKALDSKNTTQTVQEIGRLALLAADIGATRISTQALRIQGQVEVGAWEEAAASLEKLNTYIEQALELLC